MRVVPVIYLVQVYMSQHSGAEYYSCKRPPTGPILWECESVRLRTGQLLVGRGLGGAEVHQACRHGGAALGADD